MARKTIHIPEALEERVEKFGSTSDSFSGIVQDALQEYLDAREESAVETVD